MIKLTRLLLLFYGLMTTLPAMAARLIEAESVLQTKQFSGGDGTLDQKLSAFGGACLGNEFGRRRGDWADYTVEGPGGPATLYLRYAWNPKIANAEKNPPRLRVHLDRAAGKSVALDKLPTIILPTTLDWDVWHWVNVPVGEVAAGPHTLRLEMIEGERPINLDALILAPAKEVPPEVSRPLLFDGSKHLRIQLSPGVKPLEMDKLFAIGEATYRFLKEYLGEEPSQRVTVHVISPVEAGDSHVGHSTGYSMYLAENTILDTSINWAHEMTHCFQRERGPWTTWLSEGEAWLTYYEAETAVFGRAPSAIIWSPASFRARLPRYKEALIEDGQNLIQFWGTPRLPGNKISSAYGFTNYMLAELRERYGPHLMRRYRELLREDAVKLPTNADQLSPEQRDANVIERLGRAAGAALRPLFKEWGFKL